MSCGVDYRCGPDLMLLWLWRRLAAAAPFQPLAWEPPYAVDAALKSIKREREREREREKELLILYSKYFWFQSLASVS